MADKAETHERSFTGELVKVVYEKEGQQAGRTAFGIYHFTNLGNQKKVTVVGHLHPVVMGAVYELSGVAERNEKFNEWQMKLKKSKISDQLSTRGIVNYLTKEGPNIGEVRAEQIVKLFGKDTLAIIENNPAMLAERIPGFTLERATKVSEWFKGEKLIFKVKERLYEIGLTPNQIGKIIAMYGNQAAAKLKEDCFQITKIDGIGFLTAAKIADKIGVPPTDVKRIKAGIVYAFQQIMDDGHVCVEHEDLIRASCELLKVHKQHIIDQIKIMLDEKELLKHDADIADFCTDLQLFEDLSATVTI